MDNNEATEQNVSPIHYDLQINTEDEYVLSISINKEISLKL